MFQIGDLSSFLIGAQADHPILVRAVVDWNLSNEFLLFIEEMHINNTVAIICSKLQNLKQILQLKFEENVNWVICPVFFAVPFCFKGYFARGINIWPWRLEPQVAQAHYESREQHYPT